MHNNYYQWRYDLGVEIPDEGQLSFDQLFGLKDPYANTRIDLSNELIRYEQQSFPIETIDLCQDDDDDDKDLPQENENDKNILQEDEYGNSLEPSTSKINPV